MIFKLAFVTIFSLLFIYSIVRPFSSFVARMFLLFGSILGILSLIGIEYAQFVADFLGIGRTVDVYLYLGLVTIFLFITYTINRLDQIDKRISQLVKKIALAEGKKIKKDKNL